MKLVIFILFLASCSWQNSLHRNTASKLQVNLFEDLKSWNDGFYVKGRTRLKIPSVDKLKQVYDESADLHFFMSRLIELGLNSNFSSRNQYEIVTQKLFALKKYIRLNKNKKDDYLKYSILVTTLAEETLNIMQLKFKRKNPIYKQVYAGNEIKKTCVINGKKRIGKLHKINICQGDIFVSKGRGGSSSFIAAMTDASANFSHSTLAYIPPTPKSKSNVYLIESFTEDGVKLRESSKYYGEVGMTKFSVFRYQNKEMLLEHRIKTIQAVDQFVAKMKERVGTSDDTFTDIQEIASYPYDFEMNAHNGEKLFCSEVPYAIYNNYVKNKLFNPYPSDSWSRLRPNAGILTSFMGLMETNLPAPAAIEDNKNFDTVAIVYNLPALQFDRYDKVMIDLLIEILNEKSEYSEAIAKVFEPLSKLEAESLLSTAVQLGMLAKEKADEFSEAIPDGVNVNQLIVFGLLDKVLAPKLREVMKAHEDKYIAKTGRPFDYDKIKELELVVIDGMLKELYKKLMSFFPQK